MSATLDLAAAVVALMDGLTGGSPPEPLLGAARGLLLDHLSSLRAGADDPVVMAAVELGDALGNAPLMVVGEATNEIQRNIVKQLVQRAGVGS